MNLSTRFTFSRGEVAKFFFGRSISWLVKQEAKPMILPSGNEWRPTFTDTGKRRYTLDDIHSVATVLLSRGDIRPPRALAIINLIESMSELWEN